MLDSWNSVRCALFAVAVFATFSLSAGELGIRLVRNEQFTESLAGLRAGDAYDDRASRHLLTLDLIAIAELQKASAGSLDLDRFDRKVWADHFATFADLMIGGRTLRRAEPAARDAIEDFDQRERETWNALDEALEEPDRAALREAWPGLVRAMRARHRSLKPLVVFFHMATHNLEKTKAAFGGASTLGAFAASLAILATLDWRFSRNWFWTETRMAEGLLGFAAYLRVPPQTGFCEDRLLR